MRNLPLLISTFIIALLIEGKDMVVTGALVATYDDLHNVSEKADLFPEAGQSKAAAFELMALEFTA